ncbi:MAG: phosphotransferase [Candidatus Bathyarchaeota archaeon]|nr:phosphotransferase [Candidatus Bathyarchaeota archaeon]
MQKQVIAALLNPDTYDEDPGRIQLVQTHISFIFLTKNYAYKVKKAVDLGFLDFTTLEKRQYFCDQELELNRRLCREMYLEVVPITRSKSIKIKGEGEIVEYAVKMVRMPTEKLMSKLLQANQVDEKLIDRLAKIIAGFHSKGETNRMISEFGSISMLKANWEENFEQTQDFVTKTISPRSFDLIHERIEDFLKNNKRFLENRVKEDKIRDCHGDIHSGNIFVTDKIYIFDAIEFNHRFRYSDVVSDVAFLAMDLDFKGRIALSEFLINRYTMYSQDLQLTRLLAFYKCYRAYVRGKVVSFKIKDSNISSVEKAAALKEAREYFKLALKYTEALDP